MCRNYLSISFLAEDHRVSRKSTIWRNVLKYQQHGTSHNLNQGRSGRKKAARTEENIGMVRDILLDNPTVSTRRNELPLTKFSFNRIILRDLMWYPYKMQVRHQLLDTDFPRRVRYAEWLNQKNVRFMGNDVIFMNGKVNSHNVRCCAPKGHPPQFHFDVNICKEKLSLWIGLCGNRRLVGPFFYDNTLNGLKYLDMIDDEIIPELRRIYGDQFGRIWWFQDRALLTDHSS